MKAIQQLSRNAVHRQPASLFSNVYFDPQAPFLRVFEGVVFYGFLVVRTIRRCCR
jgi:hypothetical protein